MTQTQKNKLELVDEQDDMNNKLLNLAIAQIQSSLNESTSTVSGLASDLTMMMTQVSQLQSWVKQQDTSINSSAELSELCDSISKHVQKTIVSFQFYDRLRQRLEHVSDSLTELSEQPTLELLMRSKERHTMLEEDAILDMIIAGMTAKEIMSYQAQNAGESLQAEPHDVELF